MILFIWSLIFILSLLVLIKSADWLTEAAVTLSYNLKAPPFITGLVILSLGTSLPELAAGIAAVFQGKPEVSAAIAVGSTIVNLLLNVGIVAVLAGTLVIRKKLVDFDATLFIIDVILFFLFVSDGVINLFEGIILFLAFLVYAFYALAENKGDGMTTEDLITPELLDAKTETKLMQIVPTRFEKSRAYSQKNKDLDLKNFFYLILGVLGLTAGSVFTVEAVINLADLLRVSGTLIAFTMLAIAAALPELFVAVSAASERKYDLALGNIYGSSLVNLLVVSGVCAMFAPLRLDNLTMSVGLPFLFAASLIFAVSGIPKRIHFWEGIMYLFIYFVFIVKIFGLF